MIVGRSAAMLPLHHDLHITFRFADARIIPYHCDGLIVPKSWRDRLVSCVVLSGDEWDRLSDHNPVVAEFCG